MIIENSGLKGLKSDLAHLDECMEQLGFVRWQWEYYRATYDLKLEDKASRSEYFLRINTRVETGKLESPYAILYVEDTYIGKATFPHGLDYNSPIPDFIMKAAAGKLAELKSKLTH
ncbi:YugN-like family protein [Paenibacillus sp. UNCCL117]|uniref:YugN family protein n=1 Tax=unclassified Paenibacillus TaxID=185978 RepID=UPI000881351B|nr:MULTISPECIES: YugN family protein [unclassified Paenibacillus]SDD99211.1 YugN-like family protein [Paenibacillus sp. cl123]SFW55777.1 YugN-like family protein [Paenibacillus sp. UNCCL117]